MELQEIDSGFADSSRPLAIIGGGFSGTLTAIHLSRRLPATPVILFEETGVAGPGLAYQVASASARLNVPAGRMSAFQDQPDHFLQFARRCFDKASNSRDFLPRSVYGDYLKECLSEARAVNPSLRVDGRRVVDITGSDENGSARLLLDDQSTFAAALVVLATGNQDSAFASSVWASHTLPARDPRSLDRVEHGQDVLIIGSGLTMMDTVAELNRRGNVGAIHVVSRNALLPQPYAPAAILSAPDLDYLPDSNLRRSVRMFRRAIREHEAKGGDWRDLFASLRPSTPSLWQELSQKDRGRFLRFFSPFWEIHRHQCAPETHAIVLELINSGKLRIQKGTIVSVEPGENHKRLGLAARSHNEATRWLEADHILDATGPARDLESIRHPLIRNLLRRGFLKPDTHRLGAETSVDYRSIGRGGQVSKWLYVIGPMLRPRFFEATAVAELRLHAAALASKIESAVNDRMADESPNQIPIHAET
ncbi:MAG: FAD/NAD(P)-binding protein [Luteolibacter sp.]|jgi:uncharacterized NAD(P)/FAD-binding protein YdhS|nr:FAD/NAD(P)-binding protein [Luteolibacter sp.]